MTLVIKEEQQNSAYTFTSMFEDAVIGGMRGKSISARAALPQHPIRKAYLLLALSLTSPFNPMHKWKIVLDEVVLTREYKPFIEASIGNTIRSLFVYDVTSAIKSCEPTLRVVYDGRNPVRIDVASLITLHDYPNFHTYIEGYVRIESLVKQLSLTYGIPTSFTPNEGKIFLAVSTMKNDILKILDKGTNSAMEYTLSPGINLIEMDLSKHDTRTIEIAASSMHTIHLFSILAYSHTIYPRIEVEELRIDGDSLRLVLKNTSQESADDAMVVLLRLGTVIAQQKVGPIKGEERVEVNIPLSGRHTPSLVRIVWRKATRTFLNDIRPQL